MVRAKNLISDLAFANLSHEPFRHDKVIQSPTNIFGASVHHVGPKCVLLFQIGVKVAIGVNEAFLQQVVKA